MLHYLKYLKNSILQLIARFVPIGNKQRVWLHRWRGVSIGKDVHIQHDVMIETAYPELVKLGDRVHLGIRTTIAAHLHVLAAKTSDPEGFSVSIEEDAHVGTGVIILQNVTIGRGSVITAGSVVSSSVPPATMVQGNPAKPVAKCGVPLGWHTPMKEFLKNLRPLCK